MHKFLIAGACAGVILILATPVSADEPVKGSEIVVTAARSAQTADEALASVSVITRADIESSQADTLVDLLQLQAGIDVLRQGGPGKQTSLFIRGANSDHTLVLIDGVRVAASTTGAFQWDNLSLNQIERIEIVRGARSSLYGSEALGGVINIFTRKSDSVDAQIHVGSFGTHGVNASTSVGSKYRMKVNAGYQQSDGFSARNATAGTSYDSDNDGYVHKNLGLGLDAQLSDTIKLELNNWNAQNYNQFDKGESGSTSQTLSAAVNITPGPQMAHRLSVNVLQDKLHTYNSSEISTERQSANWQTDISLNKQTLLVIGADTRKDHGKNIGLPGGTAVFDNSITNTAGFLSLHKKFATQSIEVSARQDQHSNFGSHTTGQVSWGQKLKNANRLYASYGNGFKAPDLNELYHPGYGGFYAGNTGLRPEESTSVELGFKQKPGASQITASLFHTRINDLIDYSGTSNQAINISNAVMYGLELSHQYNQNKWAVKTNLTLQRSLNEATGTALLKRANEKLSFQLRRSLARKTNIMAELFYSGGHEEYGPVIMPAYVVVNLAAQKRFNRQWSLEGRINNIFNRKYEISPGYNTIPLSYLVNLKYRPDGQ